MRVLMATHQYAPAIGGAERYCTDLTRELARRGHRVDVYTGRSTEYRSWRNILPAHDDVDEVDVRRFRNLPRTSHTWHVLAAGWHLHRQHDSLWSAPLLIYGNGPIAPGLFWSVLRNAPAYDLVHINNLHYAHAFFAFWAARLRHRPIVLTPHLHREQPETFDANYLRSMLRHADAVIAQSSAEYDLIMAEQLNRHTVVGGNGLRLEEFPSIDPHAARGHFGLPDDAFVILFLGRKIAYKGLELCLRAFSGLRRVVPNAYLLAVGPETDDSQALWDRYATVPGLVVRGAVHDAERLAALAACDVLALPSSGEAFGIVYLEAWAYAKPVIGGQIAAVASLVNDGHNGFLIALDDPRELQERLTWLAENPDKRRKMGQHGLAELHRRYTMPKIADVVEATYCRTKRRHATKRTGWPSCAST